MSLAGVVDLHMAWDKQLSNNAVGEFIGGPPSECSERYSSASPREMLPLGIPHILIHGTDDENVPYEISSTYHEAALSAGDNAELVTLKDAGHFEVIDPKSAEWKQVEQAVTRLAT